jgi:hypothetical protein
MPVARIRAGGSTATAPPGRPDAELWTMPMPILRGAHGEHAGMGQKLSTLLGRESREGAEEPL